LGRSERRALGVVVGFFGVAYALYGLFRHWNFGSSAFDLGIFDQVVWHLSRFEAPGSSIRGFSNFLGDHFFPVVALFAPFYWISPGPATLIVVQALGSAVSIVPVYLFARSRLPAGPALGMAIAYGCFWGIQRAIAFDVHETAFSPLVIAVAILAMDRRRWPLFWISIVAMLFIKEDHIPLVAGFGMLLVIQGEWRRGLVAIAGGVAAMVAVVGVVIPAFNDLGGYEYTSSYLGVLADPWRIPLAMVSPPIKIETALLWFAPFAFLSLASPLALLIVPFALIRFLSDSPNHWGTLFHYSAPLAPIVAMSAADGLARIARHLTERAAHRLVAWAAAVCVLFAAILPGRQPLWRVFAPEHYRASPSALVGRSLLSMIPAGASVVAQAAVVPHLSLRDRIYVLNDRAPDADYVLACESLSPWPAAAFDELRRLLEDRKTGGYEVMVERDGWTLLRHRSPSEIAIGRWLDTDRARRP
jgi:uncharacterized membrane protein